MLGVKKEESHIEFPTPAILQQKSEQLGSKIQCRCSWCRGKGPRQPMMTMDGKVGETIEGLQQICIDEYKIERLSLKALATAAKVKVVSMLPGMGPRHGSSDEADPLENMTFPALGGHPDDDTWSLVSSEEAFEILDDLLEDDEWLLTDEENNTTPTSSSLAGSPSDVTSQALNFKAALLGPRKTQTKCPYQALKNEALRAAIKEASAQAAEDQEAEPQALDASEAQDPILPSSTCDLESSTEEYDPSALLNLRRDIGAWKKTRNTKQVYNMLTAKEKREASKAKGKGPKK